MLPVAFLERMQELLGEEYAAFRAALDMPAVRGVRLNGLKAQALTKLPFNVTPLNYYNGGYILEDEIEIGKHPLHHAGAIYVQDPAAMATLGALDIEQGWRVLDLCAAPGGKSSQAAAALMGTGMLLANEYVPKRARILVSNLERMGVRNAIVTSMDSGRLAELYPAYFDLVICDAPCSGEGMFRKSDEAVADWSVANVCACALRQGEILDNAAKAVRAGGKLLYSTCTYAPEENELCIRDFLLRNPDFCIIPVKKELENATRPGLCELTPEIPEMVYTRRCYPHAMRGEGQFIALLMRVSGRDNAPKLKDKLQPLGRAEGEICESFLKANMRKMPEGKLCKVGENAVIIPEGLAMPPHSVFMSGVLLGEIRGKLLFPAHQFFSAYGCDFKNVCELDGEEARKYVAGEELGCEQTAAGWVALTYGGAVLGGGKATGGRIKNHYPKGLRTR